MKKTFILLTGLLFSASTQAQLLDELKSKIKDKTGVDLETITNTSTNNKTSTTQAKTTASSSVSTANLGNLTTSQISSGLKEALTLGVSEGVKKLSASGGFYKNEAVKIVMPDDLKNVETKLRALGLGNLADQGIKLLNQAAENAVAEATPIFTNAITSMTIIDAKNILLGGNNAATNYLQTKTQSQLFTAFEPKVKASLGKVGADAAWKNLIAKYNTFTGKKISTDLNEYVTNETINGVFKMVAEKENGIRNDSALRTTSLLQKVFGAQ